MSHAVSIYNPLPRALRHYQDELVSVVAATGRPVTVAQAPSAEIAGASAVGRARAVLDDVRGRVHAARAGHDLVVCWPVFGLADPGLWSATFPTARITVLVHDPVPLRRQVGMGQLARRLGRLGTRHGAVTVGVHSAPARDAVVAMGWPEPALLPHPVLPRATVGARTGEIVLVCGQYKPARDLRLMHRIAGPLRERGLRPVIRGRGWPAVDGWEVQEGFLTEEALDTALAGAAVVLIPYSHFFQSGIAVRAVELSVPVAGPRHPFLTALLGEDWPGLVAGADPAEWAEAVVAAGGRAADIHRRAQLLRARCEEAWDEHLGRQPG